MKKGIILLIIILSLLLSACGTSEGAIQTAIFETEQAAPADTDVPIPADTNTPLPEPTATTQPTKTLRPTNTPIPEPEAEVTQLKNYVASTGSIYFIGIIENKTEAPIEYVKMYITLRDAEGTLVASNHSYSVLGEIPGMGYSPIQVILQDAPEDFATYDVNLEFRLYTDDLFMPNLEILSHSSSIRSTGSTKILGEIANNGDVALEYVKIIATAYDSEGNFVGFNYSYSEFDEIPSGGASPFDIIIQDKGLGAIDHYDLLFSGREIN